MSSTGFGGQLHSISQSGMMLFELGAINTGIGGVAVDLMSAPIMPGQYTLEVKTGVGGVEIFLPRYAQYIIEGGAGFGGNSSHQGLEAWRKLRRTFHAMALPENPPEFALAPVDTANPVSIRFTIKTGMGGIDVYQL